jgi:hypothetical protein
MRKLDLASMMVNRNEQKETLLEWIVSHADHGSDINRMELTSELVNSHMHVTAMCDQCKAARAFIYPVMEQK